MSPRPVNCRRLCTVLLVAALATLAGCVVRTDPTRPIPSAFVAAPHAATRLVVVLPGRSDDLQKLQRSGVAEAVQSVWPDADVVLAEVTLPYYQAGGAARRLHDEVIAPARARGYREVWLAGASMGGMGTIMYDAAYPGDVDGMVLLAPYIGDRPMLDEIYAAGGVARWNPGPPQPVNGDTWQRELWRHLQRWDREPDRARNVWLAYGEDDRLSEAMPFLVPMLPPEQVFVRDGGHSWRVWSPAMREILARVESSGGNRGRAR